MLILTFQTPPTPLTPPTPPTPQTPQTPQTPYPQGKEAAMEQEENLEQGRRYWRGMGEIVTHYICSSRCTAEITGKF